MFCWFTPLYLRMWSIILFELATDQTDLFSFYEGLKPSHIRHPDPNLCTMADHKILYLMAESSKKLDRIKESIHYLRERVKSCVTAYSKGHINEIDMLLSYENLMESLVENKLYAEGLKTFKKIKLHMLDSEDFGEETFLYYQKLQAEAKTLYHQDNRGTERYKYGRLPYQDKTIMMGRTIYAIGKICQWKCEVYKGRDKYFPLF